MPTERRILGQTQHTQQIPLGVQQLNTMQQTAPTTGLMSSTLPATTGITTAGSTLAPQSGFVQSSTLPSSGFVQSSALPTSGLISSTIERFPASGFASSAQEMMPGSNLSAAMPINTTSSSGFIGTTAPVSSGRIVEQPILGSVATTAPRNLKAVVTDTLIEESTGRTKGI